MENEKSPEIRYSFKSPVVNSAINPLGRTVFLKSGTWEHHIAVGHTEINQESMMRNVTNPTYISSYPLTTNSSSKGQRYNYYSLTKNNGKIYCLKTVTEYVDDDHEDIVTSHLMRKIQTEGEIIYGEE